MQVLRLMLKTKDGLIIETPLHYYAAAQQSNNSNPDVVKALISAGAKVNATRDKDGSDSFA